MKKLTIISCLLLAAAITISAQQSGFPKLTGPYLGQKPPGMTPEVFAPGIVSTKDAREFSGAFSPDGKEYFFFRLGQGAGMMVSRLSDEGWTNPRPVDFNSGHMDREPHITPDGKVLLYSSNRNFPGNTAERWPSQVWFMEKTGGSWGQPKHLSMGMAPTSSANGNIFIGSTVYRLTKDGLVETGQLDFDPGVAESERRPRQHTCMALDESYHVFDCDEALYVSFRTKNRTWGKPVSLDQVLGLPGGKMLPTLSPDGKILFFCHQGDIYWVSADIIAALQPKESNFPKLSGPYLGQKPPGMIPEIFAPGIVSTGMSESAIAVAPDGQEIFYSVLAGNSETIITTRFENGCWTAPEVAPFSGKYLDGFPAMHPDGSKLFFHSYRPLDKGSQISDVVNIWFVEKKGAGWSEPKPIGPPVNGNGFVCCPSVTKTGTLYYSKKTRDGGETIYRSRFVNGKYMEPEELPRQVNREKEQYHTVISPDESYLILPRDNYLVSFRDEHDQWSDLIPLSNAVNEMRSGGCPSISSDGQYVFLAAYPKVKWNRYFEEHHTFKNLQEITLQRPASDRTDIFWVDAKIIEELRPKK